MKLGRTNNVVKRSVTCLYPLEVSDCVREMSCASALEPVSSAGPSKGISDDQLSSDGASTELRERATEEASEDGDLQFATNLPVSTGSRPSRVAAHDSIFKRRILKQT